MSAELELIEAFLKLRKIKGWCFREFPLIPSHLVEIHTQSLRTLHQFPRADLVCFEGEKLYFESLENLTIREFLELLKRVAGRTVWVLEAKNKLTRDVIGDILFDREMLPLCYPEMAMNARFGVIVREVDRLYLEIALSLGIEVFVVGSRQIMKLGCREINGVFCMDISDRVPTKPLTASSLYKHVENYLKSLNAKEVVVSSLPVKVEFLNTIIIYWRNEPKCEVFINDEGSITINYCNEPCVIVIYQKAPGDEHDVRILVAKNEPPIMRWAKNGNKDSDSFK